MSATAAEAGVSPDTLRYYERLGLDRPARTTSGYGVYDVRTAERVRFIKGAQRTGLRLADIRDLLAIRDRGQARVATPGRCWNSASARSTTSSVASAACGTSCGR
jgi:DNA-binding transcriptional MerR regulator